jgi:hypothetical protein
VKYFVTLTPPHAAQTAQTAQTAQPVQQGAQRLRPVRNSVQNDSRATFLSTVTFLLACGGNLPPRIPEPEGPATMAVEVAADGGELSDARVMELGRGYAELLYAGNYDQLWQHLTPESKARFGTVDGFRSGGEDAMNGLGAESAVLRESVELPRAGMMADRLYLRVSHYSASAGTPVRLMIGLKHDGSIVGLQLRPAE